MKDIKSYITEKYKLTKNAANSYVYVSFINDLEPLQYRICYSREKLIDWIKNGTYKYIRVIIKAKAVYEEDIIKNEEERLKKCNKEENISQANIESNRWLKSIGAEQINTTSKAAYIHFIDSDKDF